MSDLRKEMIEIVRGEKNLEHTSGYGSYFRQVGDQWVFNENLSPPILPSIVDIAYGFMKYKNNKDQLKQWASFILSAIGIINLDQLESDEKGEIVLNALWDASFSDPVSKDTFLVIEDIVLDSVAKR
jgi:hypothetical protein